MIDLYEQERFLYDKTWPGYANKYKKAAALDKMAKQLNISSKYNFQYLFFDINVFCKCCIAIYNYLI